MSLQTSKYILTYSIDGKKDTLEVLVKLVFKEGYIRNGENIVKCVVLVNGSIEDREDINHYLNTKLAINDIYPEYKNKIKREARNNNKNFRTIKEILK